jgi:hypothetical protein
MIKQFKDVSVGTSFTKGGVIYTKIEDERISCCQVWNSQNVETKEKSMTLPLDEVDTQE